MYWRRRFIVLVVGLMVLGLAAWGLSSASSARPQPGGRPGHGHHRGVSDSSRATTAQADVGASGSGGRAIGRTAQPRSGDELGREHGRGQGRGHRRGPGAGGSSGGQASGRGTILPAFCARSDIVLSIYSGQTQYGRRQRPEIDLNIVSTQRTGCSFNLGSAHLILVIKEGPSRIWTSADCADGTAGLITELRRGVPTVVPITWDRRTSTPGCAGPSREVPPGTYTAYATDNGVKSRSITLRLA